MRNIVLIGMTGCGKSSGGFALAKALGRPFVDLDELVVELAGESIPDMFNKGENYFREQETEAVRYVSQTEGQVIATGGGVVLRQENIDLLKKRGQIIFIDRPVTSIRQDIKVQGRPLLKESGKDVLDQMHQDRYSLYLSAGNYRIENTDDFQSFVQNLVNVVKKMEKNNEN